MKKKFINGLLLTALFVGFTSSMISCKDYDDEKVADLQGHLINTETSLRDALNQKAADLQANIESVQAKLDSCQARCMAYRSYVDSTYVRLVKFESELAAVYTRLGIMYYTKTEVADYVQQKLNERYTNQEIEDLIHELAGQVYTKEDIDTKLAALRGLLDGYVKTEALEQAKAELLQQTRKELNATRNELVEKINAVEALLAGYVKVETLNDYAKTGDLNAYVKTEELAAEVNKLLSDSNSALYDELTNYFTNNPAILQYIQQNVTTGISAADVEGMLNTLKAQILVEVDGKIADATALANQALNLAKENEATLKTVRADLEGLTGTVDGLGSAVTTLNTTVDEQGQLIVSLTSTVNTLNSSIISLGEQVDEVRTTATEAKAQAEANSIVIANLQNSYAALASKLDDVKDNLEGGISGLKSDLAETNTQLEELAAKVAADEAAANQLHSEMLETISGLVSAIAENAEKVGDLQVKINAEVAAMNEKVQALNEKLQALNGQLQALNESISANSEAVNELATTVKEILAKFITGIEVNGTNNPLFGGFNLPINVRSNILVAFHGTSGNGINFPTDDADYYALSEAEQWNVITEKDIEMLGGDLTKVKGRVRIGAEQPIIAKDGAAGNAGTLYLTVNPTNRNFEGTEFTLINSQNVESPVKLAKIQKSDATLKFGITRGTVSTDNQSANGFYEALASLQVADVKAAQMNLDFAGIKEVARDIKNFRNGIDLSNLASTIYNNVTDVLDANAVKATWEDADGQKSVVSQYAIAATAVKPLSFGFAQEFSYDHIPGIGRVEKVIDRLLNKIHFSLPAMKDIDFNIDEIHLGIPTFDEVSGDWHVEIEITIPKEMLSTVVHINPITGQTEEKVITVDFSDMTYTWYEPVYDFTTGAKIDEIQHTEHITLADGSTSISSDKFTIAFTTDAQDIDVNFKDDVTVTVDITEKLTEVIGDLYGDITDPLTNVEKTINDMLGNINDLMDDINGYLKQINDISIDNIVGDVKAEIHKYINALNKRFARFMAPNKYLQPIMLVKNSQGYSRLSENRLYPARTTSTSLQLIPTTYNAEILSPAYKKFIAVTNVTKGSASAQNGDAACKSALDKANAQDRINEVIDGGFDKFIDFQVQRGFTYEILYTAVDYSGKNVAKKFYVKVN